MKSARAIGFATSRHLPHLLGHDLLVDAELDMWLTARRILSDMAERTDEYFLVSGRKFTLRELMAVIEEESGRTLNISWGARSYNQGEVMDSYTDGPVLPGWSHKVTLEEAFATCFSALVGELEANGDDAERQ